MRLDAGAKIGGADLCKRRALALAEEHRIRRAEALTIGRDKAQALMRFDLRRDTRADRGAKCGRARSLKMPLGAAIRDAMREAIFDVIAQKIGADAAAEREALAKAQIEIGVDADVERGDCGVPPVVPDAHLRRLDE